MKNLSMKILTPFLEKSESFTQLKIIEKLMNFGIPFNSPHSFKFNKLSLNSAKMTLPFKRANKNHLGTAHACAIATLGEYPAGLLLIKNFSPTKYRFVMTKLEAEYTKHGVGDLVGTVDIDEAMKTRIKNELETEGVAQVRMTTKISNSKSQAVAEISTRWQIKKWDLVKEH